MAEGTSESPVQAEPRTEAERTEASTSSTLLLDRLRAPQPSDLTPVGKKRHQPSKISHDPKSVSPHQRLREFANENLTVSAGKLFCTRNLLYRTTRRFRLCYNIMVDRMESQLCHVCISCNSM